MAKIAIIGAGIAGLSAAHFLDKKGHDITVFEASDRVGGAIHSEVKNGYTLEYGPNTVLLNSKGIIELVRSVGLWDKVKSPVDSASKNRFIIKDGKLNPVPTSPKQFFSTPLLSRKAKFKLIGEPFRKAHKAIDNPSIADFTRYRFGEEFYNHFINPFVTGIYAGNPEQMACKHAMKILWECEQEGGSVFKGFMKRGKRIKKENAQLDYELPKNKMFTFEGGLQTLSKTIHEQLGEKIKTKSLVKIVSGKGSENRIILENGNEEQFDKIIITTPAYVIEQLIHEQFLKTQLSNIKYAPIVVIHFGFKKDQIGKKIEGFGTLTMEKEPKSFLGLLFNSSIFPHTAPKGEALYTAIIGGTRSPELTQLPEEELKAKVLKDIQDLLDINGEPCFYNYWKHDKAIPQYSMNHGDLMEEVLKFEQYNEGIHILGNFVRGISVGDCANKGWEMAMKH